ncbi:MAG: nitrous oxide reductase [Castellaniella sp.]|uniref:nitrous oxide reductase accessory protein NosL n=1 Tax=Castellaniella sp. TaxID=1955812 RepID=UPI0011F63129|nr:nitrous oxide reductase accessory protein NosL [Castellaniella sp.]TAN25119.1 MAG: nitrous oxide reductase [Castellaniella sp.]
MKYHSTQPQVSVFRASLSALLLSLLLLTGCERHVLPPSQQPVAIEDDDICAVCGMYIKDSPGPRGEAYVEGHKQPLKFDSTRDFFAYILQPDNATRLQNLFVQDSARINWAHPSNSADSFTDARTAYYVGWQPLLGSMGPTLASFARKEDADQFIRDHGGHLLRFDEITPEMISLLGATPPRDGSLALKLVPSSHTERKTH